MRWRALRQRFFPLIGAGAVALLRRTDLRTRAPQDLIQSIR